MRSSLQHELDELFKILNNNNYANQEVSDSAFCQARQKLNPTAFIELNRIALDFFYSHFSYKTWKGHRLIAIDGSKINLPFSVSIQQDFHDPYTNGSGKKIHMANISQAFDVLNNISLDAQIESIKGNKGSEMEMALQHISILKRGDLVLADRGYPGFVFFKALLTAELEFCIRLSSSSWKPVKHFMDSNDEQRIVEIETGIEPRKKCKEKGLSITPIMVRLIKVQLKNGQTEILATSLLDTEKYPISVFNNLYHLRWGVEESYKKLKHRLDIENFSGKSTLAVKQDFYAKLLSINLTSILVFENNIYKKGPKTKYKYQINWSHAIRKFRNFVVPLLLGDINMKEITLILDIINSSFLPIRTGRNNPRVKRVYARRIFSNCKP